jgi:hypothetical protein
MDEKRLMNEILLAQNMDWLHIIAVIALIVIGVVIYFNKRSN